MPIKFFGLHSIFWGIFFTSFIIYLVLSHIFLVKCLFYWTIFTCVTWQITSFTIKHSITKLLNVRKIFTFFFITLSLITAGTVVVCVSYFVIFKDNILFPQVNGLIASFIAPFALISSSTAFITVFKINNNKRKADVIDVQSYQKQHEIEFQYLRSQFNPLFIINTLNFVNSIVKENPTLAKKVLHRLIDMHNYQIEVYDSSTITIGRELKNIKNYIEIEKMRKGNDLKVTTNFHKSVYNYQLPPFLLMPFIDNAFKYVSTYTDKENYITMNMFIKDNFFNLEVYNTISDRVPDSKDQRGLGLNYVKRRLELFFKGNYDLTVCRKRNTCNVSLRIKLAGN